MRPLLKRLHFHDSEAVEFAAWIIAVYILLVFCCLISIESGLKLLGAAAAIPFLGFAASNLFGTSEDRKRLFTWANLVTFIRLALLACFTGLFLESKSGPWLSLCKPCCVFRSAQYHVVA